MNLNREHLAPDPLESAPFVLAQKEASKRLMIPRLLEQLTNPQIPVVLDFDNTMMFTHPLQKLAADRVAVELGLRFTSFNPAWRGKPDEEIFKLMLDPAQHDLIPTALARRTAILIELAESAPDLGQFAMPGMAALVRFLRAHQRQVAVATNSPDRFVELFVERYQVDGEPIEDVFPVAAIVGTTTIANNLSSLATVTECIKPNPIPVLMAADALLGQVSPAGVPMNHQQLFMIGDSATDHAAFVELAKAKTLNVTGLTVNPARGKEMPDWHDGSGMYYTDSLLNIIPVEYHHALSPAQTN